MVRLWAKAAPLTSSPTLEHSRFAEPARNPGAAFPECVQGGAAKGSSEESRQRCALCQGPAAFPAQPGGGWARGVCLGGATLEPAPQSSDSGPLSSRMSATATWSCSPPTSTSRPMVLKDSLSRCGEMREVLGEGESRPLGGRGALALLSRYALAGAVTTDGAECLPPRGV